MQSFQRNKDSPNAMVVDEDEDKEYDEEEMWVEVAQFTIRYSLYPSTASLLIES